MGFNSVFKGLIYWHNSSKATYRNKKEIVIIIIIIINFFFNHEMILSRFVGPASYGVQNKNQEDRIVLK